MICTFKGPRGVETTCQGDSGGPLVTSDPELNGAATLAGVASWGGKGACLD